MNTVDRLVTPRGVKSGRDNAGATNSGSGGVVIGASIDLAVFAAITNTPSRSRASTRPRATSSS